ncbi:MAG: hypothetical protein HUU29_08225 [Planctomycetaceae bacterium]|nr:hypothetical protein [Planctomycetaceae bacterium]
MKLIVLPICVAVAVGCASAPDDTSEKRAPVNFKDIVAYHFETLPRVAEEDVKSLAGIEQQVLKAATELASRLAAGHYDITGQQDNIVVQPVALQASDGRRNVYFDVYVNGGLVVDYKIVSIIDMKTGLAVGYAEGGE